MAKITKKNENYSKWYNDLVIKAGLAETSGVRGCMIIKPYGYSIWELMQRALDDMLKESGHQNVYFPIFIPKSYFSKEASHVKGFAKECAVVTHYRLKANPIGGGIVVDSSAKLEEELIVRPTSETIIWDTYKKWIQSYRDLPLLLNQWANVVRWEMRTRLFLRTSEFLWQEGHTAHEHRDEAIDEAMKVLNIYESFVEKWMAIPVIKGIKSESERFAGAENTYTIEALMQDGKALQMGTSHFLGQNFAKAFDVKFTGRDGKENYVWATSWGVSTRLIGGLIMTHSDDYGLILPPKLAPIQVVIIPIYKGQEQRERVSLEANKIEAALKKHGIKTKFDGSDMYKPGWKFNEYELKGVPIRISIGERDIKNGVIEISRRDTLEKYSIPNTELVRHITSLLEEIQNSLFIKALKKRNDCITQVNSFDEFQNVLKKKRGFVSAHWDGTSETEELIKQKTKATLRCIPLAQKCEEGKCIYSGKPSKKRALFAIAY